jgi:tRNA1Val (adenine37-N6)-methyltransferase
MPRNEFTFKKFSVNQQRNVMKVGTDAVLLGSWVKPKDAKSILDIGTGTGLLALMMAQKSNAGIDALDIDAEAFKQAKENFNRSPWKDRLTVYHIALQDFAITHSGKYDLIISNPPFFLHAHKSGSESRNIARHLDNSLTIPDLSDNVKKLLNPDGIFCVIFPLKEGVKFMEYSETNSLYVNKITRVKTKAQKEGKRIMLELSPIRKTLYEDEIVLQDDEMNFTSQYKKLTAEFYLQG